MECMSISKNEDCWRQKKGTSGSKEDVRMTSDLYDNNGSKWPHEELWLWNKILYTRLGFLTRNWRYGFPVWNNQTKNGMENHLWNHLIQKASPHKPIVEDPSTLKAEIDILCKYVWTLSTWCKLDK